MLESVFNKVAFIKKKLQHWCFPVKFVKFLRTPILKNVCERLFQYFQYNSHHHFHYYYFHYHRKTRLYRLRILVTTHLDCNMIPCLFQLNFAFLSVIYFSLGLLQAFHFLRPVKGHRFCLWPLDKFRCFLYTYIYIYGYLHFLMYINCLYLFTLAYLYSCCLYTITWTWENCWNIRNTETTKKFSRLKSISCIEDNFSIVILLYSNLFVFSVSLQL